MAALQVLAQLLRTPHAGATLAALTCDLGKGCGEYLLQQVDWVLQVGSLHESFVRKKYKSRMRMQIRISN